MSTISSMKPPATNKALRPLMGWTRTRGWTTGGKAAANLGRISSPKARTTAFSKAGPYQWRTDRPSQTRCMTGDNSS